MALVLSFDVGTTNLKAGIFDQNGKLLALEKAGTPIERSPGGAAEQDPQVLFDTIISLCKKVIKGRESKVRLIVPATYQFGLILLDKNNIPLTKISTLLDTRASSTFNEFKEHYYIGKLYEESGCPPFFQYPLARLFYFSRKEPELLKKATTIASAKDYLLFRLTGTWCSELSVASASQYFDFKKLAWNEAVLSAINISASQVPPLIDGADETFKVTSEIASTLGIGKDTQVLPGFYDGGALALGLSGLEPEVAVMNIGTSGMLRVPIFEPIIDHSGSMRLQTYYLTKGTYLTGAGINNAGIALTWIKNLLSEDAWELNLKELNTPGDLFFLPYLTGERDARAGNFASGVFFGAREHHTRSHFLLSGFEGVGYSLRSTEEALLDSGLRYKSIRAGGGGTAHTTWMEILATILDRPLEISLCEEAGLIGSSILGYTKLGVFKDFTEGAKTMGIMGNTISPTSTKTLAYSKHYQFYKDLFRTLEGSFRDHQSLTTPH